MGDPLYGEKAAVSRKEPKERPACPTCYRQLAMTQDGWACTKHGVQDIDKGKKK